MLHLHFHSLWWGFIECIKFIFAGINTENTSFFKDYIGWRSEFVIFTYRVRQQFASWFIHVKDDSWYHLVLHFTPCLSWIPEYSSLLFIKTNYFDYLFICTWQVIKKNVVWFITIVYTRIITCILHFQVTLSTRFHYFLPKFNLCPPFGIWNVKLSFFMAAQRSGLHCFLDKLTLKT